jgi:uncharacterized membrane protein
MTKTLSALFDDYSEASAAVSALEAAGIPHSDISIVANNSDGRHPDDRTSDVGTGAGAGAAVGGIGGLLTGLGIMAIPGVGPVVAAGWLVATAVGAVAGAAIGGAAGGLIGSLTSSGVPEDEAHVYAEGVRRGGTLVTARVDDSREADAHAILQRRKSVDIRARGQAYRSGGWSRFDDRAPPYTAEQVQRERALYR